MRIRRGFEVALIAFTLTVGSLATNLSAHADPLSTAAQPTAPQRQVRYLKPVNDVTPPSPVTDLRLLSRTATSVSLHWANPTDADFEYLLLRRATGTVAPATASEGTPVVVLNKHKTGFVDTGLQPDTTYSYSVFARDQTYNLSPGSGVNVSTLPATPAQTGLAGTLTDPVGIALPAVQVELRQLGTGTRIATTTTSLNGTFQFLNVKPAQYQLCYLPSDATTGPSTTGYLSGCYQHGSYDSIGKSGTPVTVTSGHITAGLIDRLSIAGAIAGRVTDTTGKALASVAVTISNPNGYSRTTTTHLDGRYQVNGLPVQGYQVCFAGSTAAGGGVNGYLDQCYNGGVSSKMVPTTAGHLRGGVDAMLIPAGAITGRITDSLGAGVAGVELRVNGDNFSSTTTAADGSYAVRGLTAGSYLVCYDGTLAATAIAPFGYTDACTSGSTPVTVAAGVASIYNGTVQRSGQLVGTISGGGTLLSGVQVTVYDSTGTALNSVASDPSGRFVFTGLNPGTVTVCFDPARAGIGQYLASCYDDQTQGAPAGTPIIITGGQKSTVLGQVTAGPTIAGKLTNASAQPIAGVLVTAIGLNQFGYYTALTDSTGNYSMVNLVPDSYQICFDASHATGPAIGGYASECYSNKQSFEDATLVPLAAHTVATINADLVRGAEVSGRVTDLAGHPLSDVAVDIEGADGSYLGGNAFTDANGNYQVDGLPATLVSVCFQPGSDGGANGTGYLSQCYSGQADPSTATPVRTISGQVTPNIGAALKDAPAA